MKSSHNNQLELQKNVALELTRSPTTENTPMAVQLLPRSLPLDASNQKVK